MGIAKNVIEKSELELTQKSWIGAEFELNKRNWSQPRSWPTPYIHNDELCSFKLGTFKMLTLKSSHSYADSVQTSELTLIGGTVLELFDVAATNKHPPGTTENHTTTRRIRCCSGQTGLKFPPCWCATGAPYNIRNRIIYNHNLFYLHSHTIYYICRPTLAQY